MLTLQDCIAYCQLTAAEVEAIADHEHLPDLPALELGDYIIHGKDGERKIKRIIVDDLEDAVARGDEKAEKKYRNLLRQFIETHPSVRDI
jgi:hypothetical protein